MINFDRSEKRSRGFTVVELMVIIVAIGILAAIGIVSYGSWKTSVTTVQLKSDLNGVAAAMENARNFGTGYPATIPTTFTPSSGVTLSGGSLDGGKSFCINAINGNQRYNSSNQYKSPLAGICPILYLDAGIAASYPGTGTVLTDLSGNGKNGVLSGGVGYSSGNGGSLVFDGVNDIINLGTGNTFFPLPNFSMELWFKSNGTTPTTGTIPGLLGITYGIRLLVFSSYLNFSLDNNGVLPTDLNTNGTYSFYNSSWHQVVIQANSTTRNIYVDGLLSNTLNAGWPGATRWPTNTANIGRDNNNGYYYFNGNIASIKFYNTVLSASEISQNFNALRGRYGL